MKFEIHETVESAEATQVITGLKVSGIVIHSNGKREQLGTLGTWQAPLSWRIGHAIGRFLDRVAKLCTRVAGRMKR